MIAPAFLEALKAIAQNAQAALQESPPSVERALGQINALIQDIGSELMLNEREP